MDNVLRVIDQAAPPGPLDGRLGARALDQFFRRWPLFVLPLVLLIAVGLVNARGIDPEYLSSATVSASSNPLVEDVEVRGNTISQFEAPAAGVARLINEQLGTDAFLDEVAERAGIIGVIEAEIIDRDIVRQHVGAGARGDNVLQVSATWGDPETAALLVDSTVNAYLDYVLNVVAEDSADAIALLADVRESTELLVAEADAELEAYLAANPELLDPDTEVSTSQQFAIERLNDALASANAALDDVDNQIDSAELTSQLAQSDAGRQVRVVDAPQLATAPESVRQQQLITVVMFTVLGALVSAAALFVVMSLDRSVRLRSQLVEAVGTDMIAVVPRLKKRDRVADAEPARELAS